MLIEFESVGGVDVFVAPWQISALTHQKPAKFPTLEKWWIHLVDRDGYEVTQQEFERIRDELRSLERPPYRVTMLGRVALVGTYDDYAGDDDNELEPDELELEPDDDDGDELEPDDGDEPEQRQLIPAVSMLAVEEPGSRAFELEVFKRVYWQLYLRNEPESAVYRLVHEFDLADPKLMSKRDCYSWFESYRILCHFAGLVPLPWATFSNPERTGIHRGKFEDFIRSDDDDNTPEPEPVAPPDGLPF